MQDKCLADENCSIITFLEETPANFYDKYPSWYTFPSVSSLQKSNWTDIGSYLSDGGDPDLTFSNQCNPDFIDGQNGAIIESMDACDYYERYWCNSNFTITTFLPSFLLRASQNADGLWETGLSCPQCGCGSDNAINYNDLYEEWIANY